MDTVLVFRIFIFHFFYPNDLNLYLALCSLSEPGSASLPAVLPAAVLPAVLPAAVLPADIVRPCRQTPLLSPAPESSPVGRAGGRRQAGLISAPIRRRRTGTRRGAAVQWRRRQLGSRVAAAVPEVRVEWRTAGGTVDSEE